VDDDGTASLSPDAVIDFWICVLGWEHCLVQDVRHPVERHSAFFASRASLVRGEDWYFVIWVVFGLQAGIGATSIKGSRSSVLVYFETSRWVFCLTLYRGVLGAKYSTDNITTLYRLLTWASPNKSVRKGN
jgi:hypothetical protein